MKKKSIIILSLIISIPVLIFSAKILASPDNACMRFRYMNKHHMANMTGVPFDNNMASSLQFLETLDLSKQQREKIWSIQDDIRPKMRTNRLALSEGRKQLREIVNSDYDKNKIKKLANKQGTVITAIIMLKTEMRYRINSVLTEEQSKQFKKIRERRNINWKRMLKH